MDSEIFSIFAKVAGIGGLALAVLVFVFRDIIKATFLKPLTKKQSYNVILIIISFTFIIGILGIAAWIFKGPSNNGEGDYPKIETTSIENLKDKIASFDLNPSDPIVKLRFFADKWGISFDFKANKNMKLKTLKSAILKHFKIDEHIIYKTGPNVSINPMDLLFLSLNVNYEDVKNENETLAQAGIKDNDQISFNLMTKDQYYAMNQENEVQAQPTHEVTNPEGQNATNATTNTNNSSTSGQNVNPTPTGTQPGTSQPGTGASGTNSTPTTLSPAASVTLKDSALKAQQFSLKRNINQLFVKGKIRI